MDQVIWLAETFEGAWHLNLFSRTMVKLACATVFDVWMKNIYILDYPKCDQWRFWSSCANAQADLNLRWALVPGDTCSVVAAILRFGRITYYIIFQSRGPLEIRGSCKKVLSLGSDYFSATFYQTYFYYKPSKYSTFTETHFCNPFTQSRKAEK